MPSTPRGLTYPDSTGHTRLWEHLQNLATTTEAAIDAAHATAHDTGTGGGAIGTAYAAATDGATVTLAAGTWDLDYRALLVLSVSAARTLFMAVFADGVELAGTEIQSAAQVASATVTHTAVGFARVTLAAPATLTLRHKASATGGTQQVGYQALRATAVSP